MGARWSKYNLKVAAKILARMETGESLRNICRTPGMPTEAAVRKWVRLDLDGFSAHYARARELQMDAMSEELLEIADAPDPNGNARLRIDTRKWLMSKIVPKRFGDKQTHEHSGPGGKPIELHNLSKLSDEQLVQLENLLRLTESGGDSTGEE